MKLRAAGTKVDEAAAEKLAVEAALQSAEAVHAGGEEDDDVQDRGKMQQLKAMILQDVFERLITQSTKRHKVLENLKPYLEPMLRARLIPLELAWEVLDRMTNQQLQAALVNPSQVLLRIRFFIHLMQCDADSDAALQRISEQQLSEEQDRADVMKFIEFTLRSGMENRSMHWDEAAAIFNTLPLEELRYFGNEPDQCFEMLERTAKFYKNHKEHTKADYDDCVTVEDLNNMLMFLQKFTFEELHEVMEYAQLLLDFLQLPCSEVWRGHAARVAAMEAEIDPEEPSYKQTLRRLEEQCDFNPDEDLSHFEDSLNERPGLLESGAPIMSNGKGFDIDAPTSKERPSWEPARASHNGREMVVRGRLVNGHANGNGHRNGNSHEALPTVAEGRGSTFPAPGRRRPGPGDPPVKPSSRLAAGRIHSSAATTGVGLTQNARSPTSDEDLSERSQSDADWDEDFDDDESVTIDSDEGVDINDISLEDDHYSMRSSAASWESLQLDGFDEENMDGMSVDGRSASMSDISELTGFSSVQGSNLGRGARPAPHYNPFSRVTPLRPPSTPPDSSSRRTSSESTQGAGADTRRRSSATTAQRSAAAAPRDRLAGPARSSGAALANVAGSNSGSSSSHQNSQRSDPSQQGGSSSSKKSSGATDQASVASISKEREIQRMRELLED